MHFTNVKDVIEAFDEDEYIQDSFGEISLVKDWVKTAKEKGYYDLYPIGKTPDEIIENLVDKDKPGYSFAVCEQLAKKFNGKEEGTVDWFGDYAIWVTPMCGKTKYGDFGKMSVEEREMLVVKIYLYKLGLIPIL